MSENKVEGVREYMRKGERYKRWIEEPRTAEESSGSTVDSPGASPTEDGLIEKALRVMGAEENPLKPGRYLLRRVQIIVTLEMDIPWCQAMVIHECKLYLREKGAYNFEIEFGGIVDNPTVALFIVGAGLNGYLDVGANTEVNAYAQAVLAASGIEAEEGE